MRQSCRRRGRRRRSSRSPDRLWVTAILFAARQISTGGDLAEPEVGSVDAGLRAGSAFGGVAVGLDVAVQSECAIVIGQGALGLIFLLREAFDAASVVEEFVGAVHVAVGELLFFAAAERM